MRYSKCSFTSFLRLFDGRRKQSCSKEQHDHFLDEFYRYSYYIMNRTDITKLLEGLFDAGLLIDGSKGGAILFCNKAAQELFGLRAGTPGRFSKDIGSVASFLSFYAYSTLDFTQTRRRDILQWNQVIKYIQNDPEGAPEEWIVSATRQDDHNTTFPGVVRLTIFSSNYVVAYVRHKDTHQAMSVSTSSGRRFASSDDDNNKDTSAMVTIDETGNILKVNQTAMDTVTWCKENQIVGTHICQAAKWSTADDKNDEQQPTMTLDENGIVLAINQAAMDTIGWCHVGLVGQHLPSLESTSADGKGPDSTKQQQSAPRRRSSRWQSFRQHSSRSSSSFSKSSSPLHLVIQPTLRNERNKESLLKHQESTDSILRAIFEASLDPLFQVNERGDIQMVNSSATELFGWSREEFMGGNISMICGGAHGSKHGKYMARYLATGDTRVINTRRELPAKRKDGTEFPIELALTEVDTFLGEERLFCGFVRDLTNVKEEARAQLKKY